MAATNAISTRLIAFMFSLAVMDGDVLTELLLGAWPYRSTKHLASSTCGGN
jgi:hypothetical protein